MCRQRKTYSIETKLKAVKMYLEEGLPEHQIADTIGIVDKDRVRKWARKYRQQGEAGLIDRRGRKPGKEDLDAYVRRLEMENELLKKFHARLRR